MHQRAQAALDPADSFPELFARMGVSFARDPSRGFQAMIGELDQLEGPATDGIRLSMAEERHLAARMRAHYLRHATEKNAFVVDDPRRTTYVMDLIRGLSRDMTDRGQRQGLNVVLIQSPIPDGQAFPGGFLVFTTGLLDEPDEATIAGVIAHELAHLELGHLHAYAKRTKLAHYSFSPQPGQAQDARQLRCRQMGLVGLLMHPYRPEHEHQADCLAAAWLYRDGYDPLALAGFLERVHARERHRPEHEAPFLEILRTHPYPLTRSAHVRARHAGLQQWRPRTDLDRYAGNLERLHSVYRERGAALSGREAPGRPDPPPHERRDYAGGPP